MRRCLATRDSVSVHVAFSAERGKEVVLKVLHRGRGALVARRELRAPRHGVQAALRHRRSRRRRDLRLPRHEPVLLHRDGVLSARAPGHAARQRAGAGAKRCATRARSRTRSSIIHTAGVDPSRPEARQHHAARRRQRRADRLRHLALDARRKATPRRRDARDRGHAVLHEPRASGRRRRRTSARTSTRSA